MTLPAGGNIPWPPLEWKQAYQRYAEHAAWYSGDQVQLATVYGGIVAPPTYDSWNAQRPQPGVLWNFMNRFWSRQRTTPQTRVRMHVPLAGDIATKSADLLFSEPPEFTIPEAHEENGSSESKAIQQRLNDLAEDDGIYKTLLEAAEVAAALGGVYLRCSWDMVAVPSRPLLTAVHPDAAIPEFQWGLLTAVIFWRIVHTEGQEVWRHLERHSPGLIEHALFKGDYKTLGWPQPLSESPATADLADGLSEGDQLVTGIDQLTAVYIPNMRPNRADRNSSLGRSDYSGVEGMLDALDETYTSWMRDLRLARARIIIPQEYLENQGRGRGSLFDMDREIFTPIDGVHPSDKGGTGATGGITMFQPAIREVAHLATVSNLVSTIVTAAGYSAASFGLQGLERVQPQTATEVEARERSSFVTRNKKIRYWSQPLSEILTAYLELDRVYFGGPGADPDLRIDFSDGIEDSIDRTAPTINLLMQAQAASTYWRVKLAHPDFEEKEIAEEVDRIHSESGTMVPDPASFNPGQGAVPPAGAPVQPDPTQPGLPTAMNQQQQDDQHVTP